MEKGAACGLAPFLCEGKRKMRIEQRPIGSIKPYEKNPRKNEKAVDAVAASIREFGWQQPIVVDGNGVIIAGHTRYKAARRMGLLEVPVVVAENLTSEQVKAYRLADNKTGELAEWDFTALDEELAGIGELDMSQFGFENPGEKKENEKKYTTEIKLPQYEIQGEKPNISDLYDDEKCKALIKEIATSDLPDSEKEFLRVAAYRHIVFDYTKIAEFYAAASEGCQRLMEKSALVIIDVEDAIANGYISMCETLDCLRREDIDA